MGFLFFYLGGESLASGGGGAVAASLAHGGDPGFDLFGWKVLIFFSPWVSYVEIEFKLTAVIKQKQKKKPIRTYFLMWSALNSPTVLYKVFCQRTIF